MLGKGKDIWVEGFKGDSQIELVNQVNDWLTNKAAEHVIQDIEYTTKERRHYAIVVFSHS